MRRKVKFLTVVWGETYIERFATLALPSFLAPGNLPALAVATDLEVVIMTARRDFATFERHAAFTRLRGVCPVRFVDIDDLIVGGMYGVTLTLAYSRAVIACGEEMLRTHFVFMNADFILADGSLRGLLRHIEGGRSIVLAPSFRATAEALEPQLSAAVDPESSRLAIAPRELVGMSLTHPHPTTEAKIIGGSAMHSSEPNQFFWRVDDRTLLGRYFLIFMLCIRPERIFAAANSFCDYCFVPEMCPSGDEVVMGDSDDFFMLELQDEDQEMHLLNPGPTSKPAVAASLSTWTTAEHRRAAAADVVFHSGELPASLGTVRAEASAFVGYVLKALRPATPHVAHPYWEGAVLNFEDLARKKGLSERPPELVSETGIVRRLVRRGLRGLHRTVLGRPPAVTFLHPDWLDFLHLQAAVEKVRTESAGPVLLIRDETDLPGPAAWAGNVTTMSPAGVRRSGRSMTGPAMECGAVLVYARRSSMSKILRILGHSRSVFSGKPCFVFAHFPQDETSAPELIPVSSVGGRLKTFNREMLSLLGAQISRHGFRALLWVLPLGALWLPFLCLSNLWLRATQHEQPQSGEPSSILLRVVG